MAGKKKDQQPPAPVEPTPPASRRRFLQLAGAGAVAAGAAGVWYVRTRDGHHGHDGGVGDETDAGTTVGPAPRPAQLLTFDEHEYDTLDAVAGVLIPADDQDPGARETGAMIYIDRSMATSAFEVGARSMKVAVKALDWQSGRAHQKKFLELSPEEQDAVLHTVYRGEADRGSFKGRVFMTMMMQLVLEGHLSDPFHGGNRDGMGWKLVAFEPMDPRPGREGSGGHHHH